MTDETSGHFRRVDPRVDLPALDARVLALWDDVDELELATLDWVHYYNEYRLHSALDYLPPIEYEQQYHRQINPRPQPLPGEPALY